MGHIFGETVVVVLTWTFSGLRWIPVSEVGVWIWAGSGGAGMLRVAERESSLSARTVRQMAHFC